MEILEFFNIFPQYFELKPFIFELKIIIHTAGEKKNKGEK